MIKWLLYLIPSFILSALCYITNPLVVLLADEYGELDGVWHYWQTWDDSLDSAYFMHNCVPVWLDYGYDEHYTTCVDQGVYTAMYGKKRYFSTPIVGAEWTVKQRLQRYCCRVLWLYRNNAYGWMFYLLGEDLTHIKWHMQDNNHFLGSVGSWLTEPFTYKNETIIAGRLRWKIYLGWKTYPGEQDPQRCMLAYRIWLGVE